jgi:HTH-type transcriptional regulator / antitoxin HipB
MVKRPDSLPLGNTLRDGVVVHSALDLGNVARAARRDQGLTQLDLAGTANTGNRFIIDLEKGKPTIQLQKAIDALALLGLELVIRRKRAAS